MIDVTQILRVPCIHEEEIFGLFGDSSYYSGSSPVFNFPLYVIGFWNRSGSNLLAEYLRSTGKLHGFYEYLNHEAVTRISTENSITSFPDYFAHIAGGGIPFGVKASAHQLVMLLRFRIDRMFSGLKLVHISRQDILGQAVSMHIANQTQQWISTAAPKNTNVEFDAAQISADLIAISVSRLTFRMIAEALDVALPEISYEDLVSEPLPCVRGVMQAWDIPLGDWRPPVPAFEKQATELNEGFRSLYKQHLQNSILDAVTYPDPEPPPAEVVEEAPQVPLRRPRRWSFGRRR